MPVGNPCAPEAHLIIITLPEIPSGTERSDGLPRFNGVRNPCLPYAVSGIHFRFTEYSTNCNQLLTDGGLRSKVTQNDCALKMPWSFLCMKS